MSHPLVVNLKHHRGESTRVCRPTLYGNPWVLGPDGTRDEVCDRYEAWLREGRNFGHPAATEQRRQFILNSLFALRGKVLSCHCAPQRCHAEVLIALIEELDRA